MNSLIFLPVQILFHSYRSFSVAVEFWVDSSFNTLKMVFHFFCCYWSFHIASGVKSSHPAHSSSVSNEPFSSACSRGVFFVFSFQQFDYNVSGSGFIWIYTVVVCWRSWICRLMSFWQYGKFSTFVSSNIFPAPCFLLFF